MAIFPIPIIAVAVFIAAAIVPAILATEPTKGTTFNAPPTATGTIFEAPAMTGTIFDAPVIWYWKHQLFIQTF